MTMKRITDKNRSLGKINQAKFDSFTEEDIKRMAAEDGEDEWFDAAAKPDRVVRPYQPA